MAVHAHITSISLVESLLPLSGGSIASLFALRSGLSALLDVAEAKAAATCDNADEAAYTRVLHELWDLDQRIMDITPESLSDMRAQAAVTRYRCGDDSVHWPTLNLFLDRVAAFGASDEALHG